MHIGRGVDPVHFLTESQYVDRQLQVNLSTNLQYYIDEIRIAPSQIGLIGEP